MAARNTIIYLPLPQELGFLLIKLYATNRLRIQVGWFWGKANSVSFLGSYDSNILYVLLGGYVGLMGGYFFNFGALRL
jgi:hypothetical protein